MDFFLSIIALIYLSNVSIHSSFNRADVDGYGIEWEFDSYFFEINTLIVHFRTIHIVEISKKQIENPYSFGNYIQETRPLLLSGEKYRYFCHARNLAPRYKPARSDAKFHRVLRTVIFITIVTARENRTAAMISSRRSEKEGERERERERKISLLFYLSTPGRSMKYSNISPEPRHNRATKQYGCSWFMTLRR